MQTNTLAIIVALTTATSASTAMGANILSFDFDTNDGATPLPTRNATTAYATTGVLDPNLTLTQGVVSGAESGDSSTSFSIRYRPATAGASAEPVDSLENALLEGSYFSFIVTPAAGRQLDLAGGSLDVQYTFAQGAGTAVPDSSSLLVSNDGTFDTNDVASGTFNPSNALVNYEVST